MFNWLFGKKAQDSDGLACVACESTDVTQLAPQTYRCNVCGYEGGDGFAAWQDMQTRAAYDDWSVAQLREHAAAQLNEARGALVAVDGLKVPDGGMGVAGTAGMHLADVMSGRSGRNVIREMDEELARQIEVDKEAAIARSAAGLHAATLTLDALVDKGLIELAAVLTDARRAPMDAGGLRVRIDNCLAQLG